MLFSFKLSHQNKDVLQAALMEVFHHLWEVPESPGVKSEHPALSCIVQIIPLHILVMKREIISIGLQYCALLVN